MFSEKDLLFAIPEEKLSDLYGAKLSRKVWVFYEKKEDPTLVHDFLSKILAAVQLNMDQDVCLCALDGEKGIGVSGAFLAYKPTQIMAFGLSPEQLGLRISTQAYKPVNFYDADWIFADPLSELESDKARKGQLWTAMKQIF